MAEVIRAVEVTSPTSYRWFGRRSPPLESKLRSALTPQSARAFLIGTLELELYRSFYTQGRPLPEVQDHVATGASRGLVEALSRANTGTGGWERGWKVKQLSPLVLARNGLSVRASLSDCLVAPGELRIGADAKVRRPKESRTAPPGFYRAIGDAQHAQDALEVRLYFNISAEGAVPLTATCTRLLNEAGIPFDLKLVDHPSGYGRCDAATLYLGNGVFDRARGPLRTLLSSCATYLADDVPAFSQPLVPGLAVGEHRADLGTSFGSVRSRLVADGIVTAHERGARAVADRIDFVAQRFREDGLDIEAPYLAPGSHAGYEL